MGEAEESMTTQSHGSVTKRGWIYNGAKRTAFAYCFTYTDAEGKTQRARGQADTREGAHAAMNARKAELVAPVAATPVAVMTLASFAEEWLEAIKGDIEQRTIKNYRWGLDKHILPVLGPKSLATITRGNVIQLLSDKRAAGLGKNTVRLLRATLSALLANAVDKELVAVNVALKVGSNRRKASDTISAGERREKIKAYDRDQLARLLDVAQHDRLHPLWIFLADTGCRPNEALALKWEDIDLVGRTVHIHRALNLDKTEKGTKTNSSRRVDLSPRLCTALSRRHDMNPLVFPGYAGQAHDLDNVGAIFRRLLVKAGLPRIGGGGVYCLRHTFASHLLAMGAPITYVSHQLGHASPQVTLSVYAHFLKADSHGIAEQLEAWRSARPQQLPKDEAAQAAG